MHDHLLRVNTQVEQFRDLLSTALGANLTQISVRQNEDMRRITAWVAIAAVPTAVAGHLRHELRPHAGAAAGSSAIPRCWRVIALICLYLYRRFRRAGWL